MGVGNTGESVDERRKTSPVAPLEFGACEKVKHPRVDRKRLRYRSAGRLRAIRRHRNEEAVGTEMRGKFTGDREIATDVQDRRRLKSTPLLIVVQIPHRSYATELENMIVRFYGGVPDVPFELWAGSRTRALSEHPWSPTEHSHQNQ